MKNAGSVLAIVLLIGSANPSPAEPLAQVQSSKGYGEAYRERITKINERLRRKQIQAECKAEAKKTYSAIHFQKRRDFVKDCIARRRD